MVLGAGDVTRKTDSVSEPSVLVNTLVREDAVARFMAAEQLVRMGNAAVLALEPLATSSGFTLAR
jgi:hypothetical protein